MENMRDGTYVSPTKIRILTDAAVRDMSLADLKASIESYEEWLKRDEFYPEFSPIGLIWMRRFHRELPNKIDSILLLYDAACRELARRWYTKELEDEASSDRE